MDLHEVIFHIFALILSANNPHLRSSHLLNGTNSTRVYLDVGVPLPAWAVVSSAAGATRSAAGHGVLTSETRGIPPATDLLGVLWTFMDGGKERILAGEYVSVLLRSYYK